MTDNIGQAMLAAIASKDAQHTLTEIQQFRENMKNVEVGAVHVMWITEPANLTRVHKALAEDLSIPPRLLAIRRSMMNRTQKSVLLMQAIEMAVKRVYSL